MAQMYPLTWDETGSKFYETGVSKCVLYIRDGTGAYNKGVAWNGVSSISESPSGAEPTSIYADDIKYLTLMSNEEFSATIEAYMYPDEFAQCDGSATLVELGGVYIGQQARKTFGLCYRTVYGNDVDGNDAGYKLHIIYGCLAATSEKSYSTINDSPEAMTISWEISTTPVPVDGFKPTATITIDSTKANSAKLKELEDILYGKDEIAPRLPLPDEIKNLMSAAA